MVCLTAVLIGFTYPLPDNERLVINASYAGCIKNYPTSPCLVKLVKKTEHEYQATCGSKVKKK